MLRGAPCGRKPRAIAVGEGKAVYYSLQGYNTICLFILLTKTELFLAWEIIQKLYINSYKFI